MYDIAFIGGGPAGYEGALRAAQLGAKVVIFEKRNIGGTCLNNGCIPTKTILASVKSFRDVIEADLFGITRGEDISFNYNKIFERKNTVVEKLRTSLEKSLKSKNIDIVQEEAFISDKNSISANGKIYNASNIVIATGSKFFDIPNLKRDGGFILNSDDFLNLEKLPERTLIVGSGAIGIEWARILSGLNKEVIIIEKAKELLPMSDKSVSKRLERIFKQKRVPFFTNTVVEEMNNKTVKLNNGKEFEVDVILSAAGRVANIENIPDFIKKDERKILIDENFRTNVENIFAIGDVCGKIQLAHCASFQAIQVVEYILKNKQIKYDERHVPFVVYGEPEIAWFGSTTEQLEEKNIDFNEALFPISALGKSFADNTKEGFIKILEVDKKIVGASIISKEAASLLQTLIIAAKEGVSVTNLSEMIFPHPTLVEGISETIKMLENTTL